MELSPSAKTVLIFIAIVTLAVATVRLVRKATGGRGHEIVFTDTTDGMADPGQRSSTHIYVHVAGAVKKPGVYELEPDARVFQALTAAGGTRSDADIEVFNLSAPVEDGSKLYVPARSARVPSASVPTHNEKIPPVSVSIYSSNDVVERQPTQVQPAVSTRAPQSSSSATTSNKLTRPGEGTVNINRAKADELTRLPGVGPVTAEAIMEYRSKVGRFMTPQQIMDVKGIGPKKYEKMKPFIVCN